MKKIVAIILGLALCMTGLALAEESAVYNLGDRMEDFTVTTYDGQTVRLSDLLQTKKMVLLNIWATWCGPCESEFPAMQEAYERYQDRVAIVALSCEEADTDDVLAEYVAGHGMTFAVGRDTLNFDDKFDQPGIPTSVVIDRNGIVCMIECGAMTDALMFTNLFDQYVGDDYSEPLLLTEAPRVKPTVERQDPAALAAALGTKLAANPEDEYTWPMIAGEGEGRSVIMPGNRGIQPESAAEVDVPLTVRAGDAIAVTMKMDTYEAYDILSLKVNGRTVKKFSGEMDWFTYAIPAEADGDVVLTLTYDRTSAYNYDVEFLWIDSVAVLSGEEAAAALAANPVYPVSDAFSVTPLSPNAREIVARGDVSLNDLLSVNRAYIIPGEQRTSFAVTVGPEADPDADIIVTDNDGEATLLRDAVRDGGYVVTTGFDSMSDTGYSYADVNVYWNGLEETEGVLYFTDEANANYFFYVMLPMYGFNMTWTYTDGTAPDRDILPEEMADTEADDGISTYTARCVDAEGNPVAGVTLQVCDANSCELFTTEESGEVTWSSLAYPYEVHILLLPQGYEGDTQSTWVFPEAGGEIVINLTLK